MTRKQQQRKTRDKEIRWASHKTSIEDLALEYKLSIPTIYRILKYEN